MTLPKLIAFTGPAGVGKTVAGELVQNNSTTPHVLTSFAAPLKEMCKVLGLSDGQLRGPLKKEPIPHLNFLTPRYIMQTLGTEWGRNLISPDLWANLWRTRAEDEMQRNMGVVVDDCRFDNEATTIREMGGVVVGLTRPGVAHDNYHASERPMATLPDIVVHNNGTHQQAFCSDLFMRLENWSRDRD